LKLAYFIMCHKNSSQIARLLHAIYRHDSIYIIHADLKSGVKFVKEIEAICSGFENVHMIDPMAVSWGGWSLVEIQNCAMQKLLAMDKEWDYFINLSGQCYPLKSQAELLAFLTNNESSMGGKPSYMYFNNLEDPFYFKFFVERQETYIKEINGKAVDTGVKRPYFSEVFGNELYLSMGSQWVMLSRKFCEYVCSDTPLIARFIEYFQTFNIPDEHYIQTLMVNSPFTDRVVNNMHRFIHIPTNESHPQLLTVHQLDELLAADCFFARKVDELTDSVLLDLLDARITPLSRPSK